MNENRISNDAIIFAAETIRAGGSYPSANKVREFLGNRGSYSTISKVLKIWVEQNPNAETCDHIAPPIPPNVLEILQDRMKDIWLASYRASELQMRVRELDAIQRYEIIEHQLLDEQKIKDRLEKKLEESQQEIGALKLQIQQLQGKTALSAGAKLKIKVEDKSEEEPTPVNDLFSSALRKPIVDLKVEG